MIKRQMILLVITGLLLAACSSVAQQQVPTASGTEILVGTPESAGGSSGSAPGSSILGASATPAPGGLESPVVSTEVETEQSAPRVAAGQIDPCGLIAKQDIQNTLGMDTDSGTATVNPAGFASCLYQVKPLANQNTNATISVQVTVYQGTDQVKTVQDAISSGQAKPAADVGPNVYAVQGGVYVSYGDAYVLIVVSRGDDQAKGDREAHALAKIVLVNKPINK